MRPPAEPPRAAPTALPTVDEHASLEPPTGRRGVRGPTLFVLALMFATALASILRTCLA